MKIDMHLHTSNYSNCADSTAEEQIKAAYDNGLDAVFITEHGYLHPEDKLKKLRKKYKPLQIYQAIEVTVRDPGWEDIVVIGVHQSRINGDKWYYSELYKFVKANNGLMIHAHPYRYSDVVKINTKKYMPDMVEVLSSNIGMDKQRQRLNYIKSIGSKAIVNSDSHHIRNTGKYFTRLNYWCNSETEIIEALSEGHYTIDECFLQED